MSGVLFTCAGQRVDIVTAFKRAGARTLATDVNPLAPALYHADEHAFVPRVSDPGYVDALRALVDAHDISLIVPLTDLDHGVLARARGALGALVLLPAPEIVDALADKWLAHQLFEERGIGSPATWLPDALPDPLEFPVLVKARHGFGSRGIYRCADRRELDFFLGYTDHDSMVQAACRGEEFSIDVFCDLDGRCLNAVPRTMIESKGGESIKGMTIRDAELIEVGRARLRDARARRAGEHPVLPRARRHASRHRHQPALRRRLPAADGGRKPLSGARARAGGGRAAGAAAGRLPRRTGDDALLQ